MRARQTRCHPVAIALALSVLAPAARAHAQDSGAPTSPAARDEAADAESARLVDALLSGDWKAQDQAEKALAGRGVSGARAVLAARAKCVRAGDRARLERIAKTVVNVLLADLERPFLETGESPSAAASVGDLGACVDAAAGAALEGETPTPEQIARAGAIGQDEPKSIFESRRRARVAAAALERIGVGGLGLALEVPPVRSPACDRAIAVVFKAVYDGEAALAAKDAKAFRESLRGRADLAAPFLVAGIRDEREDVRTAFQAARDDALAHGLADLESADPERREAAHGELFRLGDLARYPLERIAKGQDPEHASPEARLSAERLARRIRFHLSPALVRKLGWELEGYEALPFTKRRSIAFELERLGGVDAVPTLRAILGLETSEEVQAVCAIGLFKQGDWMGQEWLTLHGQTVNLIPKRDLAALILDQGNKYLTARKYEQAEKQYKQVLQLEPRNEVALYNLACCYSLWGRTDEAVNYLKQAIEAGFDDVSHMDKDTDLDPIRQDPRVQAMLRALREKKDKAQQGSGGDKPAGEKDDKPDEGPGGK